MKKIAFILLLLLVSMTVKAQRPWQFGFEISQFQTAPNFKVEMSDGKTLELKKLKGKVVFLDFGGLTCGPCIAAQKTFKEKLFDKYSPKDLVVIPVITTAKDWVEINRFRERFDFDFPFGWDKEQAIKGYYRGGGNIPMWFVINRFGVVTHTGADHSFDVAIAEAIKQTENVKTRTLKGAVNAITPEVGKRIISINGYCSDLVIETKDPKSKELLAIVTKAKDNNKKVEVVIEEGTLMILAAKELDEIARVIAPKKKIVQVNIDYSKGVAFQDITLNEAFAKAKTENKKVFLDTYTSSCGPCKSMDKYIFPLESIGDFMNTNFISVKFDINKGEGVNIAQRYNIKVVPTYLILNSDGTIYHKIVSSHPENEFLEVLTTVMSDNTKTLPYMDDLYQSGKMPRSMYRDYTFAIAMAADGEKLKIVLDDLKAKIKPNEKLHPDNWTILQGAPLGSENYDFILANEKTLRAAVGEEKIDRYLFTTFNEQFASMIYLPGAAYHLSQSEKGLNNTMKHMENVNFKDKESLLEVANLMKAGIAKDSVKVSEFIRKIAQRGKNETISAMLYLAPAIGNKGDWEYLWSLKDKFLTKKTDISTTPYWEAQYDWLDKKLNPKK